MKKVLIITYYWPPAGGPAIQRILKFVKYLPQFGWQPVILTVQNGNYPVIDHSLEKDIPADCRVYKTKSIEPFNLYKKFIGKKSDEKIPDYILDSNKDNLKEVISGWIRLNLFIPDSRIGWIPFAVKAGHTIIKNENIDLIFSSSPPHTVQIIAKRLARKTKIKWIADFRDPWVDILHYEVTKRSALTEFFDSQLEKSALKHADTIICVNQQIIENFKRRVKNKYFTIYNGFDEEDFINIIKKQSDKFRITYAGSLPESSNLSTVLLTLKNIDEDVRKNIELFFYGSVNQTVRNEIEELKLTDMVKLNPYVPHQRLIEYLVNSDILLLVVPETAKNKGIITGKLFEYLATGNFILALGPKAGEAAKILEKTHGGRIYDYHEDLTEIFKQRYVSWLKKDAFTSNIEEINKFSRKNQTRTLVHIFEEVINK